MLAKQMNPMLKLTLIGIRIFFKVDSLVKLIYLQIFNPDPLNVVLNQKIVNAFLHQLYDFVEPIWFSNTYFIYFCHIL